MKAQMEMHGTLVADAIRERIEALEAELEHWRQMLARCEWAKGSTAVAKRGRRAPHLAARRK